MSVKSAVVSFQCPKCEKWLREPTGATVRCLGCRADITAPPPSPPPPPPPVRFACPRCGGAVEAAGELAGQPTTCSECGEAVRVPDGAARPDLPVERWWAFSRFDLGVLLVAALPLGWGGWYLAAEVSGYTWVCVLFVGVLAFGAWYVLGALKQHPTHMLRRIQRQVAADAERQYAIARRSGTAIDAYVRAGLVAAAYLQAQDEANYQKWKRIEAAEAARVGGGAP